MGIAKALGEKLGLFFSHLKDRNQQVCAFILGNFTVFSIFRLPTIISQKNILWLTGPTTSSDIFGSFSLSMSCSCHIVALLCRYQCYAMFVNEKQFILDVCVR